MPVDSAGVTHAALSSRSRVCSRHQPTKSRVDLVARILDAIFIPCDRAIGGDDCITSPKSINKLWLCRAKVM